MQEGRGGERIKETQQQQQKKERGEKSIHFGNVNNRLRGDL